VKSSTASEIARVAHEVNRAYCAAIGDTSQVPWEDAPEWQRASALAGVEAHLEDPTMTPQESHEAWLMLKRQEGWTWGPRKNVEMKQHPALLEYELLPVEQRAKDYLFKAVVDSLRDR
jgi:hypothetical protein